MRLDDQADAISEDGECWDAAAPRAGLAKANNRREATA
jgi:hypothetical protein